MTYSNCNKRDILFHHFVGDLNLHNVDLGHKTYHHFTGEGSSDSSIDVLLVPAKNINSEKVTGILCLKSNSNIDSHHDVILSEVSIPYRGLSDDDHGDNISAPRIENTRVKIIWSPEGILEYQKLLNPILPHLRDEWLDPSSPAFISTLLHVTNDALSAAAIATNRHVELKLDPPLRSAKLPPEVHDSSKAQDRAHKLWLKVSDDPLASVEQKQHAKDCFNLTRKEHRKVKRRSIAQMESEKNDKLFSMCQTWKVVISNSF